MSSIYTHPLGSRNRKISEFSYDEFDFDDKLQFTDEDTDDASETEEVKKEGPHVELKEQMFQTQLENLKVLLQQLKDMTHPDYLKRKKKLQHLFTEQLQENEQLYADELRDIDKEYENENRAALKEFEDKKIELKESLMAELEEKKKHIESDKFTLELVGGYFQDPLDIKPASTRKLRRRPNDPLPMPDPKRRKATPDVLSVLNFALDEEEVNDDLNLLLKVSGKPIPKKTSTVTTQNVSNHETLYDARIDDGKLYYEKKLFSRNLPIYFESKELGKVSAVISAVGPAEIWARKTTDNQKIRISVAHLQKGKFIIRKRN